MRTWIIVFVLSGVAAVSWTTIRRHRREHEAKEHDRQQLLAIQKIERARAKAEDAEEQAKDAKRRAEQALHHKITAARHAKALPQLIGKHAASLGPRFSSVKLGIKHELFLRDDVREAIAHLPTFVDFGWDFLSDRLNGAWMKFDGSCEAFDKAIRAAWGDPLGGEWLDPHMHQRGWLDSSNCTLTIERYVDAATWLGKTGTAIVPLGLLGEPLTKLRDRLQGRIDDDTGATVKWHDVGVGRGYGHTRLTARINKSKVIGVRVLADADDATRDAVVARLDALLGKHEGDGTSRLAWNHVRMQLVDGRIDLDIDSNY